ncbi:Beta-lactamase [Anaeromyxobacter dehalogenans 2CP-1]|uniref:beta-lactamase n=1 Tax=Anaeromyxobacter dehalogenans (strain ATCC BAA-258 / DSM 21875 / 2CP-1) TaxID=455488 RepID=B8JA34_ANAD2|nr:subclass B1 metallo-beta-lactamase [Anaeromyxobacter dehalogenans]ACL63737.1 Beta-lactamase [Anaeromyxobacter dehalogenans 2CP-1]
MRMLLTVALAVLPFASLADAHAHGEAEIDLGQRVWARPISRDAWIIRSVSPIAGFGDVESNAVLVAGAAESVLIDTPATEAQTAPVLAWAAETLRRPVRHLVVTHWHADRMGGIGLARPNRIRTYALGKTRALAQRHGLVVPERELRPEERLALAGVKLETWYPGHGHTADNLVVWLPANGLLVGGCFVKAAEARTLGNLEEIDPVQWAKGAAAAARRYPQPRTVVPGHGAAGGPELLRHTAELAQAYAAEHGREGERRR